MFQRLMSVALAVVILVALVVMHGRSSGRALAAAWSLVAFVFLVGLLILGYRGAEGYVLGADIIVMARVFLAFLFWLTLTSIAHTRRVSPALLFGLCFCLTEAISWLLGYFGVPLLVAAFGIDLSGYVGVMSVGLLAALVAAVLLFAASLGFGAGQLVSGAAAIPAEAEAVSREQACARFAERCKLTPRESEVMLLISRGHSFERIAEQLVVSTGTIQTHVKNLYRKTGLHSKQEIIDAVDREVAELAQAAPET